MLSQYLNSLINQIGPVAVGGVVAFLLKEIAPVGDAAINLFNQKKEAVATQVGIDKYNSNLLIAKNIWNMVDEEFRVTPTITKTIESAQTMFAEKILKVIPGISEDDIEHLRQAVAGEVNKGKEALEAPAEIKKTVHPVMKYVAEDGTELVKKDTTIDATQATV